MTWEALELCDVSMTYLGLFIVLCHHKSSWIVYTVRCLSQVCHICYLVTDTNAKYYGDK